MKKLLALLSGMALLLSAVACGDTDVSESSTAEVDTSTAVAVQEETEAAEASDDTAVTYPITIKDQAGRDVVIEKKPEKLVSGYYISTSTMIALGLEDQLVGIESKAEKRPIYKLSAPQLIDLPNVGTAKEFDLEGCIALNPDLVVLPIKLNSVVADLEKFDIDVILVNPETSDQMEEMVDILAAATDTKATADKLTAFSDDIEAQLGTISGEAPSVYLAGNASFLSTAGGAMYQSDMISLAGGKNVAADITDTYWAEVSYEDVLAWNPEYIIIASDAEYTVEDVLNDENLAEVAAIQNNHVYQLPGNAEAWDSPVPSGILGSVWCASVLHADEMRKQSCDEIIDHFYSEFYGFQYSEAN